MTTDDFCHTPLLTPERIASDPREAFKVTPPGIRTVGFTPFEPDLLPDAVVVFGKNHLVMPPFSLLTLAATFEFCRHHSVSLVTDHDGKGRVYGRLAFGKGPGNLVMLSRVLYGAAEYQEMRRIGKRSDFRPGNHVVTAGQQRSENSREIALRYVRREMEEWERSGFMPGHFTTESYMENLLRLLHMIDLESQGLDPLAALPLIKPEEAAA
jgi:hypothetical protein